LGKQCYRITTKIRDPDLVFSIKKNFNFKGKTT